MSSRNHNGPSLPQSLIEEIAGQSSSAHKHKRKGGQQLSRKDARKQARDGRKQRKAQYFSVAPNLKIQPNGKRHAEDHPDSPQRKRAKLGLQTPAVKSTVPNGHSKAGPMKKTKTALEKLVERSEGLKTSRGHSKTLSGALPRTAQEEEEDAYIEYLERKLGWVKGGQRTTDYGHGEEEDGLDDLLQDLDTLETSVPASYVDDEEDEDEEVDADEDEDEDGEDEEWMDEEGPETLENLHKKLMNEPLGPEDEDVEGEGESGEEWYGFGDSENEEVLSLMPADNSEVDGKPAAVPSAKSTSKYVPPHLRKHAETASAQLSEAQLKLTRQLKGLLNRMSEQNIASIVDGVEETYRNNRRHDVTEILTKLIVDGISSHSMLLDQYVVLHAAFVSALHKLVGIEFAAFLVQHVVMSYDSYFGALGDKLHAPSELSSDSSAPDEPVGKECSNLVVLLSELYNFQVISCVLMYDIIRALLDGNLTEFKVELLLKVARNSGQQLRQDDPTALKSIIQIVHSKLPQDAGALTSRTRFMVETLSNLKNNKVKKAAGQAAGGEAVERMKKFLSGLSKKRHVMSHEPLRTSLEDLRSAETKGKWWLVGAAWGGDPLVERQQGTLIQEVATPAPDAPSENALVKLAKKQGMNTDIRRGIFVVLMSSDDYVDACERLGQLKLTEVQQREIIRVILHCCGNEKQYNPYYALVGQQLCRFSHSHKITLQFCLWDFLRDMGETTVGGAEILKNLSEDERAGFSLKSISSTRMRNVARAFGWWIAKNCCTLAILKPVDYTVLKGPAQAFMKELFTHMLANTQLSTPLLTSDNMPSTRNKGPLEEVFVKGAKVQALALGLAYYIREAFKGEEGFLKWASEVALEVLRTGTNSVPVI